MEESDRGLIVVTTGVLRSRLHRGNRVGALAVLG